MTSNAQLNVSCHAKQASPEHQVRQHNSINTHFDQVLRRPPSDISSGSNLSEPEYADSCILCGKTGLHKRECPKSDSHIPQLLPVGNEDAVGRISELMSTSRLDAEHETIESHIPMLQCIGGRDSLDQDVEVSSDQHVKETAKPPYQPPNSERLFCDLCDDSPQGFRGVHELERHRERQHPRGIKKWICVEPADINPLYQPINPLSSCKACSQNQKMYGAYYNAAAHLRRTHFRPKISRRKSKKSTENEQWNRGGKGGGDYPPMSELKRWMKEMFIADEDPENDTSIPGVPDSKASPPNASDLPLNTGRSTSQRVWLLPEIDNNNYLCDENFMFSPSLDIDAATLSRDQEAFTGDWNTFSLGSSGGVGLRRDQDYDNMSIHYSQDIFNAHDTLQRKKTAS